MRTTLILMPGLNGTEGLFEPLVRYVHSHFNIVTMSYPTHEKKSYRDLASLVMHEIEKIEGHYILLGESFSGPLSLFVAEKKPKGLLGIILVATFITAPNFRVGRFLPWATGFHLAKPLYSLRLALSRKENQSLIASISTELQKVSPAVLSDRIKQIFSVDATESLRCCEVPLVYFRGTKDYVVPNKNLDKVLSIKPDIKVVEFNAQHFLLQSVPDLAFSAIKQFEAECAELIIRS